MRKPLVMLVFASAIISSNALAEDAGRVIQPLVPPATVSDVQPTSERLSSNSTADTECLVSGPRSPWGTDSSETLSVAPGQSCMYGFRFAGVVYDAKIAEHPRHGTVRMLNISTIEYRPDPGYQGQDSFAIEANGSGPNGTGTSTVTMNVYVQ